MERDSRPPAEPPPERDTWGAPHPLPDAVTAADIERQDGGGLKGMLRQLESDPGDRLGEYWRGMNPEYARGRLDPQRRRPRQ